MDTMAELVIRRTRPFAVIALLATLVPKPTLAQDGAGSRIIPSNAVVVTGYGTVGYLNRDENDPIPNTFSATFAPIFLFQFQDRIMFESELEFDVADGVTQTGARKEHL